MGTKNNPGAFDCDEPMFVLLGRDRHAAVLVNLWAAMREIEGEDAAKLAEARACANTMVDWVQQVRNVEPRGLRSAAQALVLLATECGMLLNITHAEGEDPRIEFVQRPRQ
jgi:hypothetical protein